MTQSEQNQVSSLKRVTAEAMRRAMSSKRGVLEDLGARYRNEARWQKAADSLRDNGQLTETWEDIGPIAKELWAGILDEDGEVLAEIVLKWANKTIMKSAQEGLSAWYEAKLASKSEAA